MNHAKKAEFRKYLLELEDYYMSEFKRVKDRKPFTAEPEKRMSLLCGHVLQKFDDTVGAE